MSPSIPETSNHQDQDHLSEVGEHQIKAKTSVEFNLHGEVVGLNATRFKSKLGDFVKTYVPISHISSLKVPKKFKDDVWNEIEKQFDVPSYLRKDVEKSISDVFRKLKHKLRKSHLDKQPNLEA